jgi:hypothetical protein
LTKIVLNPGKWLKAKASRTKAIEASRAKVRIFEEAENKAWKEHRALENEHDGQVETLWHDLLSPIDPEKREPGDVLNLEKPGHPADRFRLERNSGKRLVWRRHHAVAGFKDPVETDDLLRWIRNCLEAGGKVWIEAA